MGKKQELSIFNFFDAIKFLWSSLGSKKWIISAQKEIQAPSPPPPYPLPIFYKFDLDPLGGRCTKIKPNKNFGFFFYRAQKLQKLMLKTKNL